MKMIMKKNAEVESKFRIGNLNFSRSVTGNHHPFSCQVISSGSQSWGDFIKIPDEQSK